MFSASINFLFEDGHKGFSHRLKSSTLLSDTQDLLKIVMVHFGLADLAVLMALSRFGIVYFQSVVHVAVFLKEIVRLDLLELHQIVEVALVAVDVKPSVSAVRELLHFPQIHVELVIISPEDVERVLFVLLKSFLDLVELDVPLDDVRIVRVNIRGVDGLNVLVIDHGPFDGDSFLHETEFFSDFLLDHLIDVLPMHVRHLLESGFIILLLRLLVGVFGPERRRHLRDQVIFLKEFVDFDSRDGAVPQPILDLVDVEHDRSIVGLASSRSPEPKLL
mmetsp:Transcript_16397/g.18945  ORF Transcript_16397/g.18945 Transcript_16397/m.18945 type:complete len:276 (-) Transcript_16397:105-932(-)